MRKSHRSYKTNKQTNRFTLNQGEEDYFFWILFKDSFLNLLQRLWLLEFIATNVYGDLSFDYLDGATLEIHLWGVKESILPAISGRNLDWFQIQRSKDRAIVFPMKYSHNNGHTLKNKLVTEPPLYS